MALANVSFIWRLVCETIHCQESESRSISHDLRPKMWTGSRHTVKRCEWMKHFQFFLFHRRQTTWETVSEYSNEVKRKRKLFIFLSAVNDSFCRPWIVSTGQALCYCTVSLSGRVISIIAPVAATPQTFFQMERDAVESNSLFGDDIKISLRRRFNESIHQRVHGLRATIFLKINWIKLNRIELNYIFKLQIKLTNFIFTNN